MEKESNSTLVLTNIMKYSCSTPPTQSALSFLSAPNLKAVPKQIHVLGLF